MTLPEIRYARAGGAHVAYEIEGDGPINVLLAIGIPVSIDALWDAPAPTSFLRRLAAFSRVLLFDRRGVGLSDPVTAESPPTLEQWMEDALAVLDDAGVDRAAVLGTDSIGGQGALMLAATHPGRVSACVVVNTTARFLPDVGYPSGQASEASAAPRDASIAEWLASPETLSVIAPSRITDEEFTAWWRRSMLRSLSPAMGKALIRLRDETDIRPILPTITVPTLVVYRGGSRFYPPDHSRLLAKQIPTARIVELDGTDQLWFTDDQDALLDEVQEFLTGTRHVPETRRVLATVLFTDIVDSTKHAAEAGDKRWGQLLEQHNAVINRQLSRFEGSRVHEIGQGDGVLATFDGPARAIRCAQAIVDGVRILGIDVRCGLHTGEIDQRSDDVGGIAVHIAARVKECAGPAEVLVSRTVTDLVVGSGLEFSDRGEHELKGVPGRWQLYAVT